MKHFKENDNNKNNSESKNILLSIVKIFLIRILNEQNNTTKKNILLSIIILFVKYLVEYENEKTNGFFKPPDYTIFLDVIKNHVFRDPTIKELYNITSVPRNRNNLIVNSLVEK